MNHAKWISIVAALSSTVWAQVTVTPRRVGKDFQGQLPWIADVEGAGRLVSVRYRFLDEMGKPASEWREASPAAGSYQVWSLVAPKEFLGQITPGLYTTEWVLEWATPQGSRTERTEARIRVDAAGDGWLQRAGGEDGYSLGLTVGTTWTQSSPLALALRQGAGPRRIRYQVVSDTGEQVLRPWTELPVEKGRRAWSLSQDAGWPSGLAYLWLLIEDAAGRVHWVSREVQLGATRAGTPGSTSAPSTPSRRKAAAPGHILPAITHLAPAGANSDWLGVLDPYPVYAWSETNRVATVTATYRDDERNDPTALPSTLGQPMSLNLTADSGLGKSLYSLSYLLAPGSSVETAANQALQVSSTSVSLPQGASALQVGGVLAPVVVKPGTVEDFLGKPLAAGYGWALQSTPGIAVDAYTWTGAATAPPAVGVSAISTAADLRYQIQATAIADTGYSGTEASLDASRDPFAITFDSQDPLQRPILGKGLGAKHNSTLSAYTPPAAIRTANFNDGVQPSWLHLNTGCAISTLNGAGQLGLNPGTTFTSTDLVGMVDTYTGSDPTVYLPAPVFGSQSHARHGGIAWADAGLIGPGSRVVAAYTLTGPVAAQWIVDGDTNNPIAVDATRTYQGDPAGYHAVALQFANTGSAGGTVDDLSIEVDLAAVSVQANASDLAQAVVPGFSRTQYGLVDVPHAGRCAVTMVTDPDGSAVAEVKDPEGRTVFKIVNPTTTYTNLFKDYLGASFKPCAPVFRGALATGTDTTTTDKLNLVTQYVFDSDGHLRILVPPMGFRKLASKNLHDATLDPSALWGIAQGEANANQVLTRTSSSTATLETVTTRVPYATYNAYDLSGHLVATYNPDEKLTRFIVDQKGRVHYSQTEGQREPSRNTWTRTLYDQLFRVVAVGELKSTVVPPTDVESDVLATGDTVLAQQLNTMKADYLSTNTYDAYVSNDLSATPLASMLTLLPVSGLWKPFADGHVVQTSDFKARRDANGNVLTDANGYDIRDPQTTERYYYDQDGHVVIRWTTLQKAGAAVDYGIGIFYDYTGRVKRLVYPAGPGGDPLQVSYTYDDLGRLFAVGTPQDRSYFARYAYHPTGELKAIVYGPGDGFVAKRMLQDPQGWLRELTIQGR